MKAILEFKLPDDQINFDIALKAEEYANNLADIYNLCRDYLKHDAFAGNEEELIVKIKEMAAISLN